ncbi:LacI family DNA-binding transcriptional regulator [Leifsonia sp. L25]|uniref:LacI family DNA-binding transcriptional regulator n=1 Tax=Actinomycetes TaxID=1760 RepID=UPI003D69CB49
MSQPERRITVADVAAHAGVSPATVSQVLGGSRPVSAATRERVQQSIDELNFRPNQLARALRQQRSHTVGIVVPNITHVLYPMVARGVSEILRPLGYQVALYDTDHQDDIEQRVLATLVDRHVDGAIIFGHELTPAKAAILSDAGVQFVEGGLDGPPEHDWDTVRVDQRAAIRQITSEVWQRRGGRIAYIGGPDNEGSSYPRRDGFLDAIRALNVPGSDWSLTQTTYTWQGGREAMAELLASGPVPTSVVCANDMIAIGAMDTLRRAGLRIPDDVAVTGYDNIDAAEMAIPRSPQLKHSPTNKDGHVPGCFCNGWTAGTAESPATPPSTQRSSVANPPETRPRGWAMTARAIIACGSPR